MATIEINESNFEQEVLKSDKPVLIDFWAAWCGPCQMMSPVIEQISDEVENVKICKVNVDQSPSLAEKYNVMGIPTLVVIKDGEVAETSVGVISYPEILDLIK